MSSFGIVTLGDDLLGYTIAVDGGSTLHVTYDGQNASAQHPGQGWTAISAATGEAGGYDLYWEHVTGLHGVWHLHENGELADSGLLAPPQLLTAEALFGADWNGDGLVGLAPTFVGLKTVGTITLGTDALGYALKTDDGALLQVTYAGMNAGPNAPGQGWSAVAATVAEEGGYRLYWKHVSGTLGVWHLSEAGALSKSGLLPAQQLAHAESVFGADLDGDGISIVNGAGPLSYFVSQAPGSGKPVGIALGLNEFGYAFQPDGGGTVQVTEDGIAASLYHPGMGWHAIGVALGNESSTYELYWKNTNGQFQVWHLDAGGAKQTAALLDLPKVLAIEDRLGIDLDRDGKIGLAATFTADVTVGSVVLGHDVLGYAFSVDHAAPQHVVYGDTVASADHPGQGWHAIGLTATELGYALYWKHVSGLYGTWNLDASGHFAGASILDLVQLKAVEARHGVDLDGDNQVADNARLIASDPTVATLKDWFAAKYHRAADPSLLAYWAEQVFLGTNLYQIETDTALAVVQFGNLAGEYLDPASNNGIPVPHRGLLFSRDPTGRDIVDPDTLKGLTAADLTAGVTLYAALAGAPTSAVSLELGSTNADKILLALGTGAAAGAAHIFLDFDPTNWTTPQAFRLMAGPGEAASQAAAGVFVHALSSDPYYAALEFAAGRELLSLTVPASGAADVRISRDFTVLDGASPGHVSFVLEAKPAMPVTLVISGSGHDYLIDGAIPQQARSLVFTTENWNRPQTVELEAFEAIPGAAPGEDALHVAIESSDPAYATLPVRTVVFESSIAAAPLDGSLGFLLTEALEAVAGRLLGGLSLVDLPLLGELGTRTIGFLQTINAAIAGAIAGGTSETTFTYDQTTGTFAVGLTGLVSLAHVSVARDLGLPTLGFSTAGTVDAVLGYDLHAEGIATLAEFSLTPAATWAKVNVAADATGLSLTGHLGPLAITARDQPSPTLQDASAHGRDSSVGVELAFSFDSGTGAPQQVKLFDLTTSGLAPTAGWETLTPVVTATGTATLSLGVTTFVETNLSLVDSLLPQFTFDLTVPLSVMASASGFEHGKLVVAAPASGNVYFDNILLQAAPLITNLVGPFVKELDKWIASPILSVVEPLFLSALPIKTDVTLYQADYSAANLTRDWSWWDLLTFGSTAALKSGVAAIAEATAESVAASVSGTVSGIVNEVAKQFDTNGDDKLTLYELLSSSVDLLYQLSHEKTATAKALLQYRLGDTWGAVLNYATDVNGRSRQDNVNDLISITMTDAVPIIQLSPAGVKMLADFVKAYGLPTTSSLQTLVALMNNPLGDFDRQVDQAAELVVRKIQDDAGLRSLIETAHTVLGIVEHVYKSLKTIQQLSAGIQSVEGDLAVTSLGLSFGNRAFNLFGELGKPVTGEEVSAQSWVAGSTEYANIMKTAAAKTFADRFDPATGEFYLSPPPTSSPPATPGAWVPDKPLAALTWLDGLGNPPPALAGLIARVEDVLSSLASIGVEIPVIVNVEQVLGSLIAGKPIQLITYDPQLSPISGQFTLPVDLIDLAINTVLPALATPASSASANAILKLIRSGFDINATAQLALSYSVSENLKFGIDTKGLIDWAASGYATERAAGELFDSFFVTTNTATRTLPNGMTVTQFLPAFELSLEPSLLVGAGVANKEVGLTDLLTLMNIDKQGYAPPFWADGITVEPGLIDASLVVGLRAPSLWTADLDTVGPDGRSDGTLRLSEVIDNPFGVFDISSLAAISAGGSISGSIDPSKIVIDWGPESNWWILAGPFFKALVGSFKSGAEKVGNAVVSSLPRFSLEASGATGGVMWDTIGKQPKA